MKVWVKVSILILLVISAVFSCISCDHAEKQTGDLPPDYEPQIKGTVVLSGYNSAGEEGLTAYHAFVAAFQNKYPDAKVKLDMTITDPTSTATRISSGDIGDVFFFWENNTYPYAVTNNVLMNLTQFLEPLGSISAIFTAAP